MYQPGICESACREYARHVARVNVQGWKLSQAPRTRLQLRLRLAARLIALGMWIAPAAPEPAFGERAAASTG
jgi:hypothetical protein